MCSYKKGVFENRGAVREISTDFQSENGFELTKDRRIKFWSNDGTTDTLFFPIMSPPPYCHIKQNKNTTIHTK